MPDTINASNNRPQTRSQGGELNPGLQRSSARRGGGSGLRTSEFSAITPESAALHDQEQRRFGIGRYYDGPVDVYPGVRQPVLNPLDIPERSGAHRTNFLNETGYGSASEYVRQVVPKHYDPNNEFDGRYFDPESSSHKDGRIGYEILHANGHGQVGPISDDASNLFAGSYGANTEMMPFDRAASTAARSMGDDTISVQHRANTIPGTRFLHSMDMNFYLNDDPKPYYTRRVMGNRLGVNAAEYRRLQQEAKMLEDPANVRWLADQANGRAGKNKRLRSMVDDAAELVDPDVPAEQAADGGDIHDMLVDAAAVSDSVPTEGVESNTLGPFEPVAVEQPPPPPVTADVAPVEAATAVDPVVDPVVVE